MNIRLTSNYLGKISLLACIAMIPPAVLAICYGEWKSALAFGITIVVLAFFGVLLSCVKVYDKNLYAREGFIIVALSWVLISLFGAIPFVIEGSIPNYIDALFETVSGFTTTGASILSDVEALPYSLLYWRSFLNWLGGMGILVFILAIAPLGKGNGTNLHVLRAESPGPIVGKLAPKLHYTARILYSIYIVMTIIEIILLIIGGMPVFDSVTLSFSSAGTGGFGILNDSIASYSTYSQVVIGVFMMLFGINFNVYYLLLIKDFKSVVKSTEFKVYLSVIGISTVAIAVNIYNMYSSFGEAFKDSFFQVSSIITTTGFSTYDYNNWPEFSKAILVMLMILGACAGSTGGGLKVSRAMILFKSLKNEIKHMLYPQCISTVKIEGKPVDDSTVNSCNVFLTTYIVMLIFTVIILSLAGYGFTTNLTASIACLNNIGPGLDMVGPAGNFGFYPFYCKIVLIFDMLAGRLELFPMLLLFSPSAWKRR